MDSISYERATDLSSALRGIARPGTRFIGGGTNLLDLMKGGIERPIGLVDVSRLNWGEVSTLPDGGVRIGAQMRNSDIANHAVIRERYPLLSQALLSGASPQLRNMATLGGNLMQRTRCGYFNDTAFPECNKRVPGSGCGAIHGRNRMHAILGASPACIAVNPSDMSVALAALDATVVVTSAHGERRIALVDFHRLPGAMPQRDTVLEADELIVAVELPRSPYAAHAQYLKLRDRASYAFALVSVAAALELDGGTIRSARIALGGVAHKPWRATEAEQMLTGQPMSDALLASAAAAALRDAHPYAENGFKVKLAQRAIVRTLKMAAGGGLA